MRRPRAHLLICLAAILLATAARAATHDQIEALFRPFLAESVTLAPDGRHVAYTEHVRDELHVVIMKLEEPFSKVTLAVADDVGLTFSKEKQRATLRFLRWATANRLVFAPAEERMTVKRSRALGIFGPKYLAPILAVNADGTNPKTLIDSDDYLASVAGVPTDVDDGVHQYTRASEIVGFQAGDRDNLLVRALGYQFGSDFIPTTAFKVNIHSGKKTELEGEFILGAVGYDQQGKSRLSYLHSVHSPERSFTLQGSPPLKFSEPWLGPLAGRFTITPQNYFGERAFPLGFDADPNVLYVASNVGRDTFGIYAFNLKTKQRLDLALEDPHRDLAPLEPSYPSAQLVFDEFRGTLAGVRSPAPKPVTVWHDPEIATVQQALEKKFSRRTVEILEWSAERTAFLIRVTGGTEPGRYFVWQKPENLALEILRRAPWLAAADLHTTEHFEFNTDQGVHLTGYVTFPRKSRINPPPAIVEFADGFPTRAQPEFDREAQVLASMGFIVIRLNHRGVGGFGIKHRNAILAGVDRVPVEDALAAVDWIATRHPIDRKRVATFGNGFGGYLAVRALQLHPAAFRCAVAFNAPLNLDRWLTPPVSVEMGTTVDFPQEVKRAFIERGPTDLRTLSVLAQPEMLSNPLCLILDPVRDDAVTAANQRLRNQVRRQGGVADYLEVKPDYAAELPQARARVYDHLEEFFNLNLYDYHVKVGPTKEIK